MSSPSAGKRRMDTDVIKVDKSLFINQGGSHQIDVVDRIDD